MFFSDYDNAGAALSWPAAEAIASKIKEAEIVSICSSSVVAPDQYTALLPGQGRASMTPAEGTRAVCVYAAAMEAGLRFPLHAFYVKVLNHYRLAPSQLTPNSWAYLAAFVRLCDTAGVEPLVSLFRHFFTISAQKSKGAQWPSGWHHILPSPRRRLFTGGHLLSYRSGWKARFFFLQASSPAKSWACPVKWGKPRRANVRPPKDAEDAAIRKLLELVGETGIDLTALLSDSRCFPVGTQDSDLVELPQPAPVKTEARVAAAVTESSATTASTGIKRKSVTPPGFPAAPTFATTPIAPGFTACPTLPGCDSGHQGMMFTAQGSSERSHPPGMRTSDALQLWEALAAGERDRNQLQAEYALNLRAAKSEVAKLRRELQEAASRESRLTGSLREAQHEVALLKEEQAAERALNLRATEAQLTRLEEEQAAAVAQLNQEHEAHIARLRDTAANEVRDAVLKAKKDAVLAILPSLEHTPLKFAKLD